MKIGISFLAGLLLAGSLFAAGTTRASGDVPFRQVNNDIQPSAETTQETGALGRLALALASGREAMRNLRGSQGEADNNKDKLEPPIVEMECNIDRIANYVSCYGAPVYTEEDAENLFSRLLNELQAGLPSDRWTGTQKEPGTASIRSYTYEDQTSKAHIDIDIIARQPAGPSSYIVSIFGWPGYKVPGM
jgi:hypothetical protein